MAAKDADMPSHQALNEDIQKITQHLANLRSEMETLAAQVGRTGQHQVERARDAASDAVGAVEDAVRRDPFTAVGVAAGIGLLLGIILRR